MHKKLIKKYITNAKKRNLEWSLSEDEALELFSSDCYYCGVYPSQEFNYYNSEKYTKETYLKNTTFYNGIDRIDNNKGYFLMNCVPCCKKCNYAKRDMSIEEFEEWIDQLIKHRKQGEK